MAMRFENKKVPTESGPSDTQRNWLPGLALLLAIIVVYLPVWHAGFIWDDDDHVTANPCVIGPLGLKEIWTTDHARYYPLVTTTFWLEHKLWALAPVPYHLVNVLMHAACAVVLWQVLRRLNVAGAWLGAALWAIHPVEVETVAWITEMKNTQSCLFYLLSIFFFAGYLKESSAGTRNYLLALVCAALAMASKSSAVVLPLVLCLGAWWVDGRWNWRHQARVLPVFFMSVAAALLAIWTVVDSQGVYEDKEWLRNWPERFITAGNVIWFYLGKLVWPHPLIFIYPRWNLDASRPLSYLPLAAALLLLIVLIRLRGPVVRACLFAYAYFLIALLPVLGLVEHYFLRFSFVADHLQYLAAIGPLALAGSAFTYVVERLNDRRLRAVLCAALLLPPGILSWQRTGAFESHETIWTDTLARNPDCWMAENNLGSLRMDAGYPDEAIDHYHQALRLNPKYFMTEYNLGAALAKEGRLDEALAHYQRALELNPTYVRPYINKGAIFSQRGQVDQAIAEYRAALKIQPDLVLGHFNLASSLVQKGEIDEAIAEYRKTLKINPGYVSAHHFLGLALVQKGDAEGAAREFTILLQTNPRDAEAHYYVANALLFSKQFDAAIERYRIALTLDPGNATAHNNLGIALEQTGHPDEALAEFAQAVQLAPAFTDAQRNLAMAKEAAAKLNVPPPK